MTDQDPGAPGDGSPSSRADRELTSRPDDESRHPTLRLRRTLALGSAWRPGDPDAVAEPPDLDSELAIPPESDAPGPPARRRRPVTRRTLAVAASLAALVGAATGVVILTPAHRPAVAVVAPTPTPLQVALPAPPPDRPSARVDAAMAYDPADGDVILFGGLVIGGTGLRTLGDTWSWDGAGWTQLDPASSPPALSDALLGYDPATRRLVLTGGNTQGASNGLEETDATWTWDGSTWTPEPSGALPTSDLPGALATDEATGQLILVTTEATCQGTDTWTWGGGSWVLLHPATSPPAASVDGLAFDPGSAGLDLLEAPGGCAFSGEADQATPPAWSWNGSTWSSAPTPMASVLSASWELTTSPSGALLVSSEGTYLWNGESTSAWTEVSSSPAAGDSAVAYDAAADQVVLFGGICPTCGADAVPFTWTWNGSWTLQEGTAGAPETTSVPAALQPSAVP